VSENIVLRILCGPKRGSDGRYCIMKSFLIYILLETLLVDQVEGNEMVGHVAYLHEVIVRKHEGKGL
jgi:hypothetical protein